MAIQFARCEYISRSTGGNACRKAAYNARIAVVCERTGETFSYQTKGEVAYHEVLLPSGAKGLSNNKFLFLFYRVKILGLYESKNCSYLTIEA